MNTIDSHPYDNTEVPAYPYDYLITLNFTSIPPARLELKVGAPIMLPRNMAPGLGLCNGTRLVVSFAAMQGTGSHRAISLKFIAVMRTVSPGS